MIAKEEIKDKIKNTDFADAILLIGLYDLYKSQSNKNTNTYNIKYDLMNVKIAYDKISTYINENEIKNIKIQKLVEDRYKTLTLFVNHVEENFKNYKWEIMELITELEILLKLNITFPEISELCLNKKLEKGKEYKHAK